MKRFVFTACISLTLLSACTPWHDKQAKNSPPAHILYSPNGEPLNGGPLGRPTCAEALTRWFQHVDTNHDNIISSEEFIADAKTQFQRMDLDKNGYLVSEEVERFRLPYREFPTSLTPPEKSVSSPDTAAASGPSENSQGGHRHGGKGGGQVHATENASEEGDIDPVMSADTNLDYKVTFDEFITHARKIFSEFDKDHSGTLSQAEILNLCEKKK